MQDYQNEKNMQCIHLGDNFAYLLPDPSDFLSTEYKVVQNEKDHCVLPCMRVKFNGKTQLYYVKKGVSLRSVAHSINLQAFRTVMTNLISNLIHLDTNGFLSLRNIDLSMDRIFIDQQTWKVFLVYLPSRIHFFEDDNAFENELRRMLMQILSENPMLSTREGISMRDALASGRNDLQEMANIAKGIYGFHGSRDGWGNGSIRPQPRRNGILQLRCVTGGVNLQFIVNKDRFLIGRQADVDGCITGSKLVGRTHAQISRSNGMYYLSDLKSRNGTFLNSTRVMQPALISDGDLIRFGNLDFRAEIR